MTPAIDPFGAIVLLTLARTVTFCRRSIRECRISWRREGCGSRDDPNQDMAQGKPEPPHHAALVAAALLATAGCGSGPASSAPGREGSTDGSGTRGATAKPRVRRAKCPADVPGCVAVTGRVLYVEAVDPDGDGDAHYVLAGGGVTAPGLSAIDVAPALRPRRLPRPGELVSAAGPVRTGSHGQEQIEAVIVHHQRPRSR